MVIDIYLWINVLNEYVVGTTTTVTKSLVRLNEKERIFIFY